MRKIKKIEFFENAFGEKIDLSPPNEDFIPVIVLLDSVRLPNEVYSFDMWHKSKSGRWALPEYSKEVFKRFGAYHDEGIYNSDINQGPIARGQIYAVHKDWFIALEDKK